MCRSSVVPFVLPHARASEIYDEQRGIVFRTDCQLPRQKLPIHARLTVDAIIRGLHAERKELVPTDFRHFTRAACVLDTCSIINLDEIVLARQDVLLYMRQFFDVHVCGTIKDEFIRHRNKTSSREATYWERVLSSNTFDPSVLTENTSTIGPFYTSAPPFVGTNNAGEHGNTRVALELLLTQKVGHIIFVTDDEKARRSFLTAVRRSFPGVQLWTSIDVILYLGALLLKEGKADFDAVRAALRDVYAATAKKWDVISEKQKSEIIKDQKLSVDSLRLVKQIADQWRN